jgi:hypothetical protein
LDVGRNRSLPLAAGSVGGFVPREPFGFRLSNYFGNQLTTINAFAITERLMTGVWPFSCHNPL